MICETVSLNHVLTPLVGMQEDRITSGHAALKRIAQRRSGPERFVSKKSLSYRLELLPVIPAFHRRARNRKDFSRGQLVYYGPQPLYYGIGEVKRVVGSFVAVDFRGTGEFGVHEDVFERQYLIPIPQNKLALL